MSIESRENDLSKSLAELGEMIERNVARIATLEAERDTARAELASEREALRNVSDELQQVDEILSAAGRVRTAALRQMKDDLARKQRCIDAALQDYECDRGVHSMVSVLRPEATAKAELTSITEALERPAASIAEGINRKIRSELDRAYVKHGRDPWGRHELFGVNREELEEAVEAHEKMWDAIKSDAPQDVFLPLVRSYRDELIQTAGTCERYLEIGDRYHGPHSEATAKAEQSAQVVGVDHAKGNDTSVATVLHSPRFAEEAEGITQALRDLGINAEAVVAKPLNDSPASPPEPSGEKALRLAMGIIGVLLTSGTNRVDGSLLEPHKRQELKAIASEARGGAE